MKTKFTRFLILIILLSSCNSNKVKKPEAESPIGNSSFNNYLSQLPVLKLPLVIKGCYPAAMNMPVTEPGDDTTYIKDACILYGKLESKNYVSAITLGLADCALPCLTTYTKDGKRIATNWLAIGQCGSGPGFSCEEFMTIRSDYSIYVSDTISTSDMDSLGEIDPSTTEKYVIYKTGKVLTSGQIELSDEMKKGLK